MAHKAVQRLIKIQADADGNAPDAIHLLSVGHWHTPWHGAFEHTAQDLAEMVEHFDGSVGLIETDKSSRAPVNYGHDRGGKAAGWITELYLDYNGTELWGKTTWTKEGARALREGEYKYISPEWNPRDFPWENPEEEGAFVENVFTGAALTNIPLFKKLQPVMASIDAGGGSDKPSKPQGGDMTLTLEDVRVKKLDELTEDEKAFLVDNAADLTDEERTAFEIPADSAPNDNKEEDPAPKPESDPAPQGGDPKEASQLGITKDELEQLRADAAAGRAAQQELLQTQLTASVTSHVERGAIKADQLDTAVELLMASSQSTREKLSAFLAALPENRVVTAGELGSGKSAEGGAVEQLRNKAQAILKASAEAGRSLSYGDALAQARRENKELAKQADEE